MVFLSDDESKALSSLRELEIDILLADESYNLDPRLLPQGCVLVYLTDDPCVLRINDCRAVWKEDCPEQISVILYDLYYSRSACTVPCPPTSPPPQQPGFLDRDERGHLAADHMPECSVGLPPRGIVDWSGLPEEGFEPLESDDGGMDIPTASPWQPERDGTDWAESDYQEPPLPKPENQPIDDGKRVLRPPNLKKKLHTRVEHSLSTLNLSAIFRKMMDKREENIRLTELEKLLRTPGNDVDDVQFRCAAPMTIKPGRYFTARIMMLREDDTDRARELAGELGDKVRMASGGDTLEAETGQEFTIRLQSPDLPELDEMQKIRWNGRHAFRDFQILLPGGYDREQLRLLGRVYSHDIPMTDIRLILEVSSPMPQEVRCEKLRLRTAFVSYASKDRAEVAKRLQMLERLRPDMDVFMDRNNLNYGEEYEPRLYREIRDRDLFFLFWSHNAAASEWVNKELTYALEHKPMTRIEPVWLEKIDHCPPPEQLRHLHFWDWTQNYMED